MHICTGAGDNSGLFDSLVGQSGRLQKLFPVPEASTGFAQGQRHGTRYIGTRAWHRGDGVTQEPAGRRWVRHRQTDTHTDTQVHTDTHKDRHTDAHTRTDTHSKHITQCVGAGVGDPCTRSWPAPLKLSPAACGHLCSPGPVVAGGGAADTHVPTMWTLIKWFPWQQGLPLGWGWWCRGGADAAQWDTGPAPTYDPDLWTQDLTRPPDVVTPGTGCRAA